jgi:hypothetical protein
MAKKIRISALTNKGGITLAKSMSLDDLGEMAFLHGEVIRGNVTVEQYRQRERQMITKYGFKV